MKWSELIISLAKIVDNKIITEGDVEDMPIHEKYRLIGSDPTTCAR